MFLLIAQSAALLVAVFLFSGFIGWHLTPKPKRAVRRRSVFDEAPAPLVDATLDAPFDAPAQPPASVPVSQPVAPQFAVDPMVAAAQTLNASRQVSFTAPPATEQRSADIIPLRPVQAAPAPQTAPQPAPVGVSTELEPAIMGDVEALTPVAVATRIPEMVPDLAEPPAQAEILTEIVDRTTRPKASLLSAMTPESVSAAVEQAGTGLEPHRLHTPDGAQDDLTLISGISADGQSELNRLGIYHYWQVASWTPEHVAWLSARIHSAHRISRENWMAQAAKLASRAA